MGSRTTAPPCTTTPAPPNTTTHTSPSSSRLEKEIGLETICSAAPLLQLQTATSDPERRSAVLLRSSHLLPSNEVQGFAAEPPRLFHL